MARKEKTITIELTRDEADALGRHFAIMEVSLVINRNKYASYVNVFPPIFRKLDDAIHSAGWCDRGKNCSYELRKNKDNKQIEAKNN